MYLQNGVQSLSVKTFLPDKQQIKQHSLKSLAPFDSMDASGKADELVACNAY